uniref:VWFA domain-containing protein n=1 Tax=Lotharella oceanica TaxID=641309 RepID=A0A7S2U138_9EUKA|mmetsp:Transcript_3643/g.7024  ORF Transcript_3643/g.7024 Transcript_3643/m.7024 type:complete len:454 (+) Transcript_3643:75-1436(+)
MHAGMELGAKLLREEKEREAKSENQNAKPAIQRIFLFSDGQVNEGVQDENVLLKTVEGYVKAGITVNTFGIGKEFNEDLMTGLARAGKGNYSYLKNAKVIPGLVSKSIHRLFQTVGTEARLFVQGLSGAVVTRVFSGEEEGKQGSSSALVDGILIGDLHANNLRQVLLELEVTPKEDLDTCQVLKCELQYKTTSKVEGVSISDILKEASLPADVEKLVVDAKVPPGASVEEWEAISKNLQLKPGHWQRLKRAINSLRAAQASNSAAKAVKAKEDVKEVSITHNLDVGFTNDRKEAQAQVCDAVLCARAVQDVGAAESAVDEALERGEHKAATAAQKKSLEQLKATMEKLRDKSTAEAKFLQTCIKRGQELLDSLAKDERDARDLQLELRENQRDMRCMSLVRVALHFNNPLLFRVTLAPQHLPRVSAHTCVRFPTEGMALLRLTRPRYSCVCV